MREELAWAAGFFDGEGNTNAYRKGGSGPFVLQMSVTQVHRETLERFQRALGGLGTIYGPYSTISGRLPQYTIKIRTHEHIQAAVSMLWPWLCPPKRIQATGAIRDFRSTCRIPLSEGERLDRRRAAARKWYHANKERSHA